MHATVMKSIAVDFKAKETLAQLIHDAKMRGLDAGDKLKHRKKRFGAARRTYEAIIDLQEAQLKAAWAKCEAAEAETARLRAEMRVKELE